MPKAVKVEREHLKVKVWTLREQLFSWGDIAKATNRSKSTVRGIYRRVKNNGGFKDKPRSGRPLKLTDRDRRVIVGILNKSKKKSSEVVRKQAAVDHNIDVSTSTIRRSLKKSGYVARVKKKKPLLTIENKRKRLAWAKEHRTWTVDDWRNVVWSDETAFTLVGSSEQEYTWVKDGEDRAVLDDEAVSGTKKFGGGKLMLWGCMTWEGVGYGCKIDDILDAELYCKILRGELMDSIEYFNLDQADVVFQQDNDPKHTSIAAEETLEELGLTTMGWPPQSPDLNPIEHLWRHLKTKLREKKQVFASIEELWEAVQEELEVVNKELSRKLIASMASRVQAVINAKGGYTKY